MHYKKLILSMWITVCAPMILHSAYKTTRGSLSYIMEPVRPVIQGHLHKIYTHPITQYVKGQTSRAWNAAEKMYTPFHHPFYTGFVEPLYVGRKSSTWSKELKEQLDYLIMNAHDKFALKKYKSWKKNLSEEQLEKYKNHMKTYEKSYLAYKINPHNNEIQQELLRNTMHMHQIMEQTTPTTKERIRSSLFGE